MLRFVALCWSSLSVHSACRFGFGPDIIKHKLLVQHQLPQCLCLLACAHVSVLEVTCAEAGLLWKMPDVPKCYFMKSELRKEIESLNKWKGGERGGGGEVSVLAWGLEFSKCSLGWSRSSVIPIISIRPKLDSCEISTWGKSDSKTKLFCCWVDIVGGYSGKDYDTHIENHGNYVDLMWN